MDDKTNGHGFAFYKTAFWTIVSSLATVLILFFTRPAGLPEEKVQQMIDSSTRGLNAIEFARIKDNSDRTAESTKRLEDEQKRMGETLIKIQIAIENWENGRMR